MESLLSMGQGIWDLREFINQRESPEVPKGTFRDCKRSPSQKEAVPFPAQPLANLIHLYSFLLQHRKIRSPDNILFLISQFCKQTNYCI